MKNSLENFPQAGEQKEVIKPTHSFYFSKEAREFIDSYYPDITEDDDVYAVMKKIEEAEGMKINFAKLKDGRVVPYTSSIPLEGAEDYIGEKDSGVQLKQRKPDDIYLGDGVEFHDDEMDEKEKFMIPNT